MNLKIDHQNFITKKLELVPATWKSSSKLLLDEKEVKKEKGKFTVVGDDGNESLITFKSSFLDPVPKVFIGEEEIKLVEPLKLYEYLWIFLPILLVFGGGALGGLVGVISIYSSFRIFRSDRGVLAKYLRAGLNSILAVVSFFILAGVTNIIIESFK
jgi:hypothetical protein